MSYGKGDGRTMDLRATRVYTATKMTTNRVKPSMEPPRIKSTLGLGVSLRFAGAQTVKRATRGRG